MKCSGASSHETFMNSKHHELGNLHEIGDPNLHGISQPKGGPQDLGKTSKIRYGKPEFCVWITVRLAFSPATGGDGSLLAGSVRSYVNLRDFGDPALRISDSVANSAN